MYLVLSDGKEYKFEAASLNDAKKMFISSIKDSITILQFEEKCRGGNDIICEATYIRWKTIDKGIVYYPRKQSHKIYTLSSFIRKLVSTYKKGKDINGYTYVDFSANKIRGLDSDFDMKDYTGDDIFHDIYFDLTTVIKIKINLGFTNYTATMKNYSTLGKLSDAIIKKIRNEFGILISISSFILSNGCEIKDTSLKLRYIQTKELYVRYTVWDKYLVHGNMINSYSGENAMFHEKENRIKTMIYNIFFSMVRGTKYECFDKIYPKCDYNSETMRVALEVIIRELYQEFFSILDKVRNEPCGVCLETCDTKELVVLECKHAICYSCFSNISKADLKLEETKEIIVYDDKLSVDLPLGKFNDFNCPFCRKNINSILPIKYTGCCEVDKIYDEFQRCSHS